MKQPARSLLYSTVFIFFLSFQAHAGNIYSWTDENGVKRYSNTQPGEGAGDIEVVDEAPGDPRHSDKNRERKKLINDLKTHNKAAEEERRAEKKKQDAKKAEERAQARKEMDPKIQAEKNRLLEEIKMYENRAIGPTFSLALKNPLIKKLKDKLALLEASPEKYFESQNE